MNRVLLRTPSFERDLRKWLKSRSESTDAIESTLNQLAADVTYPTLRTHKLGGPLQGCLACSAGYDLRIVFEFVEYEGEEAILLLALGSHDEVY